MKKNYGKVETKLRYFSPSLTESFKATPLSTTLTFSCVSTSLSQIEKSWCVTLTRASQNLPYKTFSNSFFHQKTHIYTSAAPARLYQLLFWASQQINNLFLPCCGLYKSDYALMLPVIFTSCSCSGLVLWSWH